MINPSLREQALRALIAADPAEKLQQVELLADFQPAGSDLILYPGPSGADCRVPGRPQYPTLVPPQKVKTRSMHTHEGRAALIHSLAHIEFNAINLALDIVWRFPGLPDAFYRDWARVAREEALHYSLLARHLVDMGSFYGAMPAHNGLWEMAERTRDDVLARLAIVPRTLEARGLDASPVVRQKLADAGDTEAAAILDVILRDEIGHVAIGNYWYRFLCEQEGYDPVERFGVLAAQYRAPKLRGPFNLEARRAAGFSEEELRVLQHDALGL